MNVTAHIVAHRDSIVGVTVETLSWHGGRLARLSHEFMQETVRTLPIEGEPFHFGNLRLRVIDRDFYTRRYLVALDGTVARLIALLWPLTRFWSMFRSRLIVTACIWGFGTYRENCQIGWDNLHVVQTLSTWRRRWVAHVKRIAAR